MIGSIPLWFFRIKHKQYLIPGGETDA